MPAPAERRALRRKERAELDEAVEMQIDDLLERARGGRLAPAPGDVPF